MRFNRNQNLSLISPLPSRDREGAESTRAAGEIKSRLVGSPRGSHRAFTLIELLVVVGTIGLFVSMLLPSLGAAREQAKAVDCRSNIRHVAVANGYYADEYGDMYCPGGSDFLRNLQ